MSLRMALSRILKTTIPAGGRILMPCTAVVLLMLPVLVNVLLGPDPWPNRVEFRRPAQLSFPTNDPYTLAKAELGRTLFFDPSLSGTGGKACASCHNPSLSYGDGLPIERGVTGHTIGLRTPTLLDVGSNESAGWDGRFANVADVSLAAISNPGIMDANLNGVLDHLRMTSGYRQAFAQAFPGQGITPDTLRSALGTFVRTITSGPAPFDRWVAHDETAISVSAKRGFALFTGRAGCSGCHTGWSFTDGSFHDIGVAEIDVAGRGALFPNSVKLQHAFKVPTLRDVARRGPYMHDGSIPDLGAVIDLYDKGGIDRPSLSEQIHPLHLTQNERADLLAFLDTLTSDPQPVYVPIVPRP